MRIMGLDFGSRTCGVALTDELLMTAQPREIIRRERPSQLRKTLQRIEELIGENNVGMIVLGLPLNMDDSQGERATLTLEFQDKLQRRTGLPVVMSDERLTTVEADELMDEMEIRGADRKKYVDMLAASVILRDYMNSHPEKLLELRGDTAQKGE